MKPLFSIAFVAFLLLLTDFPALAQNNAPLPPPPAVSDYSPDGWKEYSFPEDNVRFRFPVEPTREKSEAEDHVTHSYSRESFMLFQLDVLMYAPDVDLGTAEDGLTIVVQSVLNRLKRFDPKVLEEKDTVVDGHSAKFIKLETNNGLILRMKLFLHKNKGYSAQAISRKGERHGFNWENDFEVPAMAFLDSLRLIKTN
jgi:hypothetical protein